MRFLVGETSTAENTDGILAIRRLSYFNSSCDSVERFLPGCGA